MSKDEMLIFAEQQIMGFTEAMRHGDIVLLAEAMGLVLDEYRAIRDDIAPYMREEDLQALDNHFGIH